MILAGIYKIVNKTNEKFYLGSTKNLENRWANHKTGLRKKRHHCLYLQNAWNKYGESSFYLEIIELFENPTKEFLLQKEDEYTKSLKPEYNIGSIGGGDNISNHPNLENIKRKHSENGKKRWENTSSEKKEEMRIESLGEKNPNWKGGISTLKKRCVKCGELNIKLMAKNKLCIKCSHRGSGNSFFGKHHTQETKEKLSVANKGKKHTDETKNKLREKTLSLLSDPNFKSKVDANRRRGKKHPLYGKPKPDNVKDALSKSNKDRWGSLEYNIDRIKYGFSKAILAENKIFLSQSQAGEFYAITSSSIFFRCKSKAIKWKDFQIVDYEFVVNNLDKIMGDYTKLLSPSLSQDDKNNSQESNLDIPNLKLN